MKRKYISHRTNLLTRLKDIFLIALLGITAIFVGLTAGNIVSDSRLEVIKKIDSEVLKTPLNLSFPLIDTVYNSGNVDYSFINQLQSILGSIFNFNLDAPTTLLNSPSPLLTRYYLESTKQWRIKNEVPDSPFNDSNVDLVKVEDKNPDEKSFQEPEIKPQIASSISTEESNEERDYSKNNLISDGEIAIQNETNLKINISELIKKPLTFSFDRKGPKILIYHTHTSESYIEGHSPDGRNGVVKVGEELAKHLRKKYGLDVIHNATINDFDYKSSYVNAYNTVTKIIKGNPSLRIIIDLHRDGLGTKGKKLRVVKNINGKNVAQIMIVVGSNATGLNHPYWKENLKLALKLEEKLNSIAPGLAKPIYISKNRYNQHVKTGALIVEVGGDGNSTAESVESTKYLAQAIGQVVSEIK